MRIATIHQLVALQATPERVYQVLMDSEHHAAFTGKAATISPTAGGEFSVCDAVITGTNISVEPGRRIIQRWRMQGWPHGHVSEVHMQLEPSSNGSMLRLVHKDVPTDRAKEVDTGWEELYWKPLRKYLKQSKPAKKPAKAAKVRSKKPASKRR